MEIVWKSVKHMNYSEHKKIFNYLRSVLAAIGFFLLIAAIIMLIAFVRSEKDTDSVTEPTIVNHRVLFLCAYNPLYFTYESQIEGLKEGLYSHGIEFDVIYMDAKNYGSEEDLLVFHDFLEQRLEKDRGYEAVLLGDDDALLFALKYQEEMFKDMPMVFFGINNPELAVLAAQNPMMTGFYEKDYLKDSMELAMKAMPDRKHYVALHDKSAAGVADEEIFYSYDQKYPDYVFEDIDCSELSINELEEKLSSIPEDAVLLYMTAYTDKSGKTFSVLDMTSRVVTYTNVPIIRNYSGGREQGVLGGIYMDFTAQCRDAALIIYDVLENGKDISLYPLDTDTPSKTDFNYEVMMKYGISESLLPEDTTYYNKPFDAIEYYGKVLPAVLLIFVALILFIITSHMTLKRQKDNIAQLKKSGEELKESHNRLIYQSEHDELLGIFNRRTIVKKLSNTIDSKDTYSVILIDIDGFKEINENYGHTIADAILKHVSRELTRIAEEENWLLGRYGGDEFILLAKDRYLDENSKEVTDILEFFRKAVITDEESIIFSASIGVSNSDGVTSPEQNIINAEIAMYEAKAHGKNTVFVYADEMQQKIKEENRIRGLLADAFDDDGFYMVYQPKVDTQTMETVGFEALVRMKGFESGPAAFVPIVEKSGWISRLGRITTQLVVTQLAEWRNQGKKLYPVSINFSSKQINDSGFVPFLRQLLEKYDIPSNLIEVEITESLLVESSEQSDRLFKEFKNMGMRILMDDFGTGYSSLAYLTYVPVDEIKLDKSLVDAYLVDGKESFIRDVILLVHDMHKKIIIEGVAEKWQYEKLRELKADSIQGYYFSVPLEADKAIDFTFNSEQ